MMLIISCVLKAYLLLIISCIHKYSKIGGVVKGCYSPPIGLRIFALEIKWIEQGKLVCTIMYIHVMSAYFSFKIFSLDSR